jgi:predicted nucleic acid-binding protein
MHEIATGRQWLRYAVAMNRPPLPLLVLDTNVVLDWLVFRDAGCRALGQALTDGRVRWAATEAMRDELAHVLARGSLDAWQPDAPALWAHWERWANIVPAPPPLAPGVPRCTDPDDQKFVDLGIHLRASALLSRDRAVLRCARGARALGLAILPPGAWLPG